MKNRKKESSPFSGFFSGYNDLWSVLIGITYIHIYVL